MNTNWHWAGECPQMVVVQFSDRIRCVHTKGVLKHANRWIVMPIADSEAPWKALGAVHGPLVPTD